MRTHSNLALKQIVTSSQIEQIVELKKAFDIQKRRLELAENALRTAETEVIVQIQAGATVLSSRDVQIRTTERRNVSWKDVAANALGHEVVQGILDRTEPTITLRLLVKS